jgi:hypothetical protein
MPWEEMTPVNGQPHIRHCAHCDLDVRDLSAMSADEAEAFLNRQRGRTCVSFMDDAKGAMLTLDYQPSAPSRPWRKPVAAAAIAVAALAAEAVGLQSRSVQFTRTTGEMPARPYGAYSPFSPGSNAACATQSRLLPIQLQQDTALQPLLAALPAGVEVVDLQYNVYPSGLPRDLGQCIVLGRRCANGASGSAAPPIAAVLWLRSSGYATADDLAAFAASDLAHPLRLLKQSADGDILIWTQDAELERVLKDATVSGDP